MSAVFLVLSAFLASAVEMVEALTIVLAAGITRGWRSSLLGVGAATGVLAAATAALGPALTLVPIAIGYHLAHYFTFLLIQGQYIITLASDPFGFGWNLFGTAVYRVDITVVDARFVKCAHARGVKVHVWTIDDRDEMVRLLDLGVDGIMTDRPAVLREVLESRGEWVA